MRFAVMASRFFLRPEKVCNALLGESTLLCAEWKYDGMGYSCVTADYCIDAISSGGLANTLTLYAESEFRDIVQEVKLVLMVNHKATRKVAINKFRDTILTLFREIGIAIPVGLIYAIYEENPTRFEQDYGTVELQLDRTRTDTWSVVILPAL